VFRTSAEIRKGMTAHCGHRGAVGHGTITTHQKRMEVRKKLKCSKL
jgi:hypothetical protein